MAAVAAVAAGAAGDHSSRRLEIARSGGALLLFSLLATAYLRPIWSIWRTHLPPPEGDPLFNLYLLKWVGHEAGRGFAGFWSPPFFYPTTGVLAYSDHMTGPGLVAAAWDRLVPGWIGAYNLILLASFVLTGWTTSLVLRRSGRSWTAALLGGALYAFCPFRWSQLEHLQMLLMAAIPLTLWTFDRLLARPGPAAAAAFLLCYGCHLTGGCYLAAMIHVPLAVLAANRLPDLLRRQPAIGRRGWTILATAGALAAAMLTATFYEYWRIADRDRLGWPSGVERYYGATLLSWLQPSPWNTYSALLPPRLHRAENSLFPGFVVTSLCIAGAAAAVRRRRGRRGDRQEPGRRWPALLLVVYGWVAADIGTLVDRPVLRSYGLGWLPGYRVSLTVVCAGIVAWTVLYRRQTGRWPRPPWNAMAAWPRGVLLAGLACALLALPMFYIPASKLVPGLTMMRVPARFQAMVAFTLAFFAAAACDRLAARLKAAGGPAARRRALLFTVAVLLAAGAEGAPRTLPWADFVEEDDFPQVYDWLADQPDVHALLELPLVARPPAWPHGASLRAMVFGTAHWHPLVNGYSAHLTPYYERLTATCCHPAPDPETLRGLAERGVTHLLIHRGKLDPGERRALDRWEATNAATVTLVYAGEGERVYALNPAAASATVASP